MPEWRVVGESPQNPKPVSSPKSLGLSPGEYTGEIGEIKGEKRTVTATVGAGETVERTVALDTP